MRDGAELSLLEVRLCLTSIGFVRTNVWLGMQRSASLKRAIARTDSTWKISREMTGNLSYGCAIRIWYRHHYLLQAERGFATSRLRSDEDGTYGNILAQNYSTRFGLVHRKRGERSVGSG